MTDYILFMHNDAPNQASEVESSAAWNQYLEFLHRSGCFEGGSSIGSGATYSRSGEPGPVASHLTGFIRVRAGSLEDARRFLAGNPVYEAGGTVEIRELPPD